MTNLVSNQQKLSKRASFIRGKTAEKNVTYSKIKKGSKFLSNTVDFNPCFFLAAVATEGLQNARNKTVALVSAISKECRSKNEKFRDSEFDLQKDPKNCIFSLDDNEFDATKVPNGVARVTSIFENPKFYSDGVNHNDIRQGADGDCWFLSALSIASNIPKVIENLCVARDEEVGVYGFIFFRDNEWVPVIIDDQLFVYFDKLQNAPPLIKNFFVGREKMYDKLIAGSNRLHFSKCRDSNETWLPLIEKAFAKANGDYNCIEGGQTGEGVENLTGGIMSQIFIGDILSKERFWNEELRYCNADRLFAVQNMSLATNDEHQGLIHYHAYGILKTCEIKGKRFLLIKNPWGESEWKGAWSDGDANWDSEWIQLLDHKFGDDGAFWQEYDDFLKSWTSIDKIQLFDNSWTLVSNWLEISPSFPSSYGDAVFKLEIKTATKACISLSQSDAFRSTTCDAFLEPGIYDIIVMVKYELNSSPSIKSLLQSTEAHDIKKFTSTASSYEFSRSKASNYVPFDIVGIGRKLLESNGQVKVSKSKVTKGVRTTKNIPKKSATVSDNENCSTEGEGEIIKVATQHDLSLNEIEETDEIKINKQFGHPTVVIGLRVYTKDKEMELTGLHGDQCENLEILEHANVPEANEIHLFGC
ncbi:hypothetical protein HK099_008606 [Clydaea vesicula]|uniref:Calpain catalytic domain-containing protein n=1 Tax=Clydaea vesicula TaxID=447962 RepID=A0AAD5TYJ8_9FUNG|nr:hypothetical protein HK099_008606 [Clydaea vesicula]